MKLTHKALPLPGPALGRQAIQNRGGAQKPCERKTKTCPVREGMGTKMKDEHENGRVAHPPQQKAHREGAKANKERETTTNGATGSTLVGTRFWARVAFDEQTHTATDTGGGGGDATRKRRKQAHPRPFDQVLERGQNDVWEFEASAPPAPAPVALFMKVLYPTSGILMTGFPAVRATMNVKILSH